jgi:hypothetical protein
MRFVGGSETAKRGTNEARHIGKIKYKTNKRHPLNLRATRTLLLARFIAVSASSGHVSRE